MLRRQSVPVVAAAGALTARHREAPVHVRRQFLAGVVVVNLLLPLPDALTHSRVPADWVRRREAHCLLFLFLFQAVAVLMIAAQR